jgi:Domain of unknown function (DUF4337)
MPEMPEVEIHHHHEEGHEKDPLGRAVGVLAALFSVLLAVVTIMSHRAHTEGVLLKTEANDKWAYYQSKRIKFHDLELGVDLIQLMGPKNSESQKVLARYAKEKEKNRKQGEETQVDAQKIEKRSAAIEAQALRYDFGEGLLEIALVLSSLYFIARRKLFPVVGVIAAILGTAVAISGYLL